jgi:hypothetical protein
MIFFVNVPPLMKKRILIISPCFLSACETLCLLIYLPFQLLNKLTDIQELWYECYAI